MQVKLKLKQHLKTVHGRNKAEVCLARTGWWFAAVRCGGGHNETVALLTKVNHKSEL